MNYNARVKCDECDGSGSMKHTLDISQIIEDINEIGTDNKINAIKHVRNTNPLGLKQAKEVVEAVFDFMGALERALPAWDKYE